VSAMPRYLFRLDCRSSIELFFIKAIDQAFHASAHKQAHQLFELEVSLSSQSFLYS
jgi:hypothetical protein